MPDLYKPWDSRLACWLVRPFKGTFVSPNHFTSLRLFFGCMACVGLASGDPLWANIGAFCFVVSHFLDHADGEFARLTGKTSKLGHYYDLCVDAGVNIALFVSMGIGLVDRYPEGYSMFMGIAAGIAVAAIFHMRHKIEVAGGKAASRQPQAFGIEAEDVLYLLPLVTLFDLQVYFLTAAAFGAPVFALWVVWVWHRKRKSVLQGES